MGCFAILLLVYQIIAKYNGQIEFPQIINGKFVRTTHGKIAFLIKQKSFFLLKELNFNQNLEASNLTTLILGENDAKVKKPISKVYGKTTKIILPLFTLLFVKQGQKVYKNQVLAEPIGFITELEQSIDIFQTIYSEFSGEIRFKNSKLIEKFNKINKKLNLNTNVNSKTGQLWVLASNKQTILKPLNLFVKKGDFVFLDSFICLYNFRFLDNIIKNKFLNTNIKKNISNLSFINPKIKLKKIEIFNFFNLIKNKSPLNQPELILSNRNDLNLFIKFDYFQLIKLIQKKYFYENKFKKLNQKSIIYSNISKYYINNLNDFKFRKTYFLPNFSIKKYSYGLKYDFIISLNSINKLIFFENKIKLYSLPIILFYFCKVNQNQFELLEKIKISHYYYIFKVPFNFIFDLNYIYKNNLKFFYNINIHKLNLDYKILFKLKNLKLCLKYTKKKLNIYNKKFFISSLKHFTSHNDINKTIENINLNLLYFFKFNKNNKKIKSYFYNKSCFNFNEIFLFNNLNNVSNLYINNLIKIFNNFNKNPSYLLFINSALNFFILAFFYKFLNKKININNNNSVYLTEISQLNLIKNQNYNDLKNFKIYFNKKINIWPFYFLLPNLKHTINNNNNLFFYNFSINIIKFYKSIAYYPLNNSYLKNKGHSEKLRLRRQVLLYDFNRFNKFNITLFKSNLYNLNYFNYLFLSFNCCLSDLENKIEKTENKIKFNFFNKINKVYYNKSLLLFNTKHYKNNIIVKKLILKQKNFIYFKIKNNILKSKMNKLYYNQNLKKYNFNLILFYFLFNISFLIKLNFLSNFSLLKIKNKYKKLEFNFNSKMKDTYLIENKINSLVFLKNNSKLNKKKILYLKKEIIYFYFSSYIFSFLLSNTKINFSNLKNFDYFNFSKIIVKFFKLKSIKIKKLDFVNNKEKKISNISKNLKILYFFKYNININNNIKYNLIFSNIFFYKFIKNINLILIIFYKFLKKFNNKKLEFFKNKINKNFFCSFSINNIISYNDLFILLFDYKNSIFNNFYLIIIQKNL